MKKHGGEGKMQTQTSNVGGDVTITNPEYLTFKVEYAFLEPRRTGKFTDYLEAYDNNNKIILKVDVYTDENGKVRNIRIKKNNYSEELSRKVIKDKSRVYNPGLVFEYIVVWLLGLDYSDYVTC